MSLKTDVIKGWKKLELENILHFVKGKPPQKFYDFKEKNTIEYLSPEYLRNKTQEVKYCEIKESVIADNDIVILWDGSNAGEIFFAKKGALASTMVKVENLEEIDKKFLYYYLKVHEPAIKYQIKGSGIPHVEKHIFKSLPNILPSFLPEQRKIAEILETIDNVIEKTDKIIEKYKKIKQGLMQEILTKGIDENGNIRSKETHRFKDSPLGRIPEEWEVVRLGDVVEKIVGGATPLRNNKKFWENGTIYWLTNKEVEEEKINYISVTKQKITTEAYKLTNVQMIPPRSVILSLTASIGKVAINLIPITTNQLFNSFILDEDKIYYLYLAYYFLYSNNRIKNLGGLTIFDFISKTKISDFKIPLPPLPEQKRIAEILSQIDEVIEKEQKYKQKLERIKHGLMEDLLTGKVRVDCLIEENNNFKLKKEAS